MKISRVEMVTIRHSWGDPHEGVTHDWPLVLIHTDGGHVGVGRGGNVETVKHDLAPLIVGEDPRRIAMLWERKYEAVWRVRGVAGVPNGLMVSVCPNVEPHEIWSRLYDPSFRVVDGQIQMTDRPGLGLEPNEDTASAASCPSTASTTIPCCEQRWKRWTAGSRRMRHHLPANILALTTGPQPSHTRFLRNSRGYPESESRRPRRGPCA